MLPIPTSTSTDGTRVSVRVRPTWLRLMNGDADINNILEILFKKKKFPCTILRLYQAYGPKQDFNRFIPIIGILQ